jgi:uncharacterized protein (DUF885 family)
MGLLLIVVTLLTSTVISTPQIDSTAIRRFDTLVEQHVHDRARHDPEWATSVGLHTADSLLTDRSTAKMHADSARLANELHRLHAIDTSALDTRRVVDWLLLQSVLQTSEHTAGQRGWQKRPGSYVPFNALYSLATGSVPAPRERMAALTARLEQWPRAIALGREQIIPHRTPTFWVGLDVANARNVARYLEAELPGIVRSSGGDPARFTMAQRRALAALRAYIAWMADTLSSAASGDWAIGPGSYDWRLRHSKLLDTSADSLVALGHRVFRETEADLAALSRSIDPSRSWRQLADSSKSLHPTADSIFAAYSREAERARVFIIKRRLFTLPAGEQLDMVLTPPNLRQTYAYGGYSSPAPFEPRQIGRFFVTPVEPDWPPERIESKLRGHNFGWITVVAVHEGYPGHHLQNVRAATQPNILRKIYGSDVFGEGWGLYAEELMYRSGFYPDSLARLTQLRMRLWRAARVIIDPSLHTGRMTIDEGVRFFTDSIGLEHSDALAEVTRYTTWPTQAVSYIVGMRAIESLRDEVRQLQGFDFDLVRFHDILLTQGSLPPPLMRRATLDLLTPKDKRIEKAP